MGPRRPPAPREAGRSLIELTVVLMLFAVISFEASGNASLPPPTNPTVPGAASVRVLSWQDF